MSEELEARSNVEEEQSDLEGNRGGSFKFEQPKIQYTRSFLLEFSEEEVCCKLPTDFDLLILHELDDSYASKAGHRSLCSSSSYDGLLPSTRCDWDLPGKRWDSNQLVLSKDSQLPVHCHSAGESGCAAGILGSKSQNSGPFQLKKCEIPYLPPHCRKVEQHAISSDKTKATYAAVLAENSKTKNLHLTKDTSDKPPGFLRPLKVPYNGTKGCVAQQNEIKGCDADGVSQTLIFGDYGIHEFITTQNSPSTNGLQVNSGGQTNAIKKIPQPMDATLESRLEPSQNSYISFIETEHSDSVDSTSGNDSFEYDVPILDIDDLLNSTDSESEDFWRNDEGIRMIPDVGKFGMMIEDDEIKFDDVWAEVSFQLEQSKLAHLPLSDDTEVEICLPDEDSLILPDQSTIPDHLNFVDLDDDIEIRLPDEDSLIALEDLIAPHSILPTINRDSTKCGSVFPKKQHSQSSCAAFLSARPSPYLATYHYPAQFSTRNTPHYIPVLNCYTSSNFHHQPIQATTKPKTNNSLVHYSLSEQPYVSPDQQNQSLIDAQCCKPNNQVPPPSFNAIPFLPLPWIAGNTMFEGFGNPKAVSLFPAVVGGLRDRNCISRSQHTENFVHDALELHKITLSDLV